MKNIKNSIIVAVLLPLCVFWLCNTHAQQVQRSSFSPKVGTLEQKLIARGLVDIQVVDADIEVDLKYSTTDNFLKRDVYGDLQRAYLQPMAAQKLARANRELKKSNPELHLLVYDAARPRTVTQLFWDYMSHIPPKKREDFVADPALGSVHNFGCAVDLTIADATGQALDMGTPFDYNGLLAYPTKETEMLKAGKLTQKQVNNRLLLRRAMKTAGYDSITSEWWHFNALAREKAKKRYGFIE